MAIRLTPRTRKTAGNVRPGLRPNLEMMESRLAPAAIVGSVFHDANGDGIRQNTEPGMPGVTVYLDLNNNGKFDPPSGGTIGDIGNKTAADGKYNLIANLVGSFNVLQVVPAGFMQTTSNPTLVTLPPTSPTSPAIPGPTFGNKQLPPPPPPGGTIHGAVFVDANGDGIRQNTEVGQPGVVVFLDLNGDGKLTPGTTLGTPGEPLVLSNNTGGYEFKVADGTYSVLELVPAGYVMTTPAPAPVTVTGGASVAGPDFGNQLIPPPPPSGGVIHGVVFIDGNGDGVRQNTEPGQGGVRVFIDLNGDGKFNPATTGATGEPSVLSANTGGYEFKVGKDGTYSVLEVVPAGFTMTTPTPAPVSVSGGAKVLGPDFGNQPTTPPPTPTGGKIVGTVFVDLNNDGIRQNTEPGQGGVIVFIDANGDGKFNPGTTPGTAGEKFTISGPAGGYEFNLAKDGAYSVLEVVPAGFTMTTPVPGPVSVAGGAKVTGPTFGNHPNMLPTPVNGFITGRVFVDANNNGKLDIGELPMSGVRVYDDANGNGKFDAGEKFTFSMAKSGRYSLVLPAGTHSIQEVVPPGFTQTTGPGTVTIVAGQGLFNRHFGNAPSTTPLPFGPSSKSPGDSGNNDELNTGDGPVVTIGYTNVFDAPVAFLGGVVV